MEIVTPKINLLLNSSNDHGTSSNKENNNKDEEFEDDEDDSLNEENSSNLEKTPDSTSTDNVDIVVKEIQKKKHINIFVQKKKVSLFIILELIYSVD